MDFKIGIIGSTPGNGHPFSWSALFNGFNAEAMSRCPYPVISQYLNKNSPYDLVDGTVTHVYCSEGEFEAKDVADSSFISNIVKNPVEMIGKVDLVLLATDIGSEHVGLARPFVEAGIPIFVDKPMVDTPEDLQVFNQWVLDGKRIMSSSAFRYAKELKPVSDVKHITTVVHKSWETYGVHALETIFNILGPNFSSVYYTGDSFLIEHSNGFSATILMRKDLPECFGVFSCYGPGGCEVLKFSDSFHAFKAQLEDFVEFIKTNIRPFPHSETYEIMKLLIAGIKSREIGKKVYLNDIR